MADREVVGILCPGGCGETHPAWASYCFRCKGYLTDLAEAARAEAGSRDEAARATAGAAEPGATGHPDPVLIVWPWDILANVNDRRAPLGEQGRRARKRYRNRRDAMAAIVAQIANGRTPFTGPVRVTFDFYPPDEREDPSNFEKAALDALEGPPGIPGIYTDDRQARHRVSIEYAIDEDRPRMEARVEAILMDDDSEGA